MTEIFARHWESLNPTTGKNYKTTTYYAICETCQEEISGPTPKRVKYLLESHEYFIHTRGLAA